MPSGEQVTSFSLAVGRQWKNKNNEKQEETEWVNCSVFGKLAEVASEYLHKGSQVFVSGRMKTDKYQAKDGSDRYSTKIIVDRLQMLGGKPSGEQQEKKFEGGAASAPKSDFSDFESDIPF
jgi:single-strand DNA-binding protein